MEGLTARETSPGMSHSTGLVPLGLSMVFLGLLRPSRLSLPLILGGGYLVYQRVRGAEEQEVPAAQSAGTITVNRTRREAYDFWRNPANLSRLLAPSGAVRRVGEARPAERWYWRMRGPLGITTGWESELTAEIAGERLAWHTRPGSLFRHGASVSFSEAPGGRGTEVHLSMEDAWPGGRLGGLLARLLGRVSGAVGREMLRHSKQIMEAGEVLSVRGQPSGRRREVEAQRAALEPGAAPEAGG